MVGVGNTSLHDAVGEEEGGASAALLAPEELLEQLPVADDHAVQATQPERKNAAK